MDYLYNTCFFERYAKFTLEDQLGSRYANLVNADRPDLQDKEHGIGIEVTRAIAENKNVAHELINQMAGEEVTEIDDYAYGTPRSENEAERRYWALALPMRRIIANKVAKVANGFYGDFNRFGLFIFTKEILKNNDIEAIIRYTDALQYPGNRSYSHLYISHVHDLFVCDLTLGTFRRYPISEEQNHKYYTGALAANIINRIPDE